MSLFSQPVAITGIAVRSCLGSTPAEHAAAMNSGRHGLLPLGGFLGSNSPHASLPGGWLADRECLHGRRCGAATNLSLALAREAVLHSRLTAADLAPAWIFAGSSRGNACELFGQHHGRRPVRKFAASNSMHSEMAAAVSIGFGIRGGWQVLSNGCSSGLDAIGMACAMVASGLAPRAIAVSADLPLVPKLLDDFAATGLLSRTGCNDPYSPLTSGFLPAEAGAALVIEPAAAAVGRTHALVHGYAVNADACDLIGLPEDGGPIAALIASVLTDRPGRRYAVCPHASGTFAHGQAEHRGLESAFASPGESVSVHLMKPFTGHSLGASGAIDTAILAHFLSRGLLPPNLPGLAGKSERLTVPAHSLSAGGVDVLKISVSMGGHNALLLLTAPP